jgi:hypothetical protein
MYPRGNEHLEISLMTPGCAPVRGESSKVRHQNVPDTATPIGAPKTSYGTDPVKPKRSFGDTCSVTHIL